MPWDLFPLVIPAAQAQTRSAGPPRTYVPTTSIRLPVQIDDKTRANLNQLKLYAKAPGGDWVCAQTGPATQTAFDYKADTDGEYAFMFVLVAKDGRTAPASLNARPPHQIIVVDTMKPILNVQSLPFANSEIYLQCQMQDANPDLESVRLEYDAGDNQWKAMELVSPDTPAVFRIPFAGVLEGKVRATARDKAGNLSQCIVDLGDPTRALTAVRPAEPTAPPQDAKVQPQVRPPLDARDASVVQSGYRPPMKNIEPVESKLPEIEVKSVSTPYNSNRPNRNESVKETVETPAIADGNASPIIDPKSTGSPVIVLPADIRQKAAKVDPYLDSNRPVSPYRQEPARPEMPRPIVPVQPETLRPIVPVQPETPRQMVPVQAETPRQLPLVQAETPRKLPLAQPETPRQMTPVRLEPASADVSGPEIAQGTHPIINTTHCNLDYAVENAVNGGLAKVEFWETNDNGRTWARLSDESGGRSPAKLALSGEGMHGIRIKASGNGQPPSIGEAADCWVEVDTTPPAVRVLPPIVGTGTDLGAVTIQWLARDKNLNTDSIAIMYANRPDGPWAPIATNQRNEGSYRWQIPQGISTEVYLRVEATDRAGNIGRNELREPVALPQPKVKVLGVGPAR